MFDLSAGRSVQPMFQSREEIKRKKLKNIFEKEIPLQTVPSDSNGNKKRTHQAEAVGLNSGTNFQYLKRKQASVARDLSYEG